MRASVNQLRHTHHVGDDTPERIIAASNCDPLQRTRIRFTGVSDAGRDYLMVRVNPAFEQLTVCVGGEGQVLVGDQWLPCTAGQAYLNPRVATHAFRTQGCKRWQFCWIIYGQPKASELPAIGGDGPRLIQAEGLGLWSAIDGLHREANGSAEPALLQCYVELIQLHAARILRPYHDNDPLWRLWEQVSSDLAADWSLERLAQQACMSAEHLRRVCHTRLDRTPMGHVTHLRMMRAATLLQSTTLKIGAIAHAVGYANPFSFSNAFHRVIGAPPQEWRSAYCKGGQRERQAS